MSARNDLTHYMPDGTKYVKDTVMCMIEGCKGKVTAKGLCAKHYMRQRRQGSPEAVGKAGRPRDPAGLAFYQSLFSDWSPRTVARYWRTVKLLELLGADVNEMISRSTRANGTVNVSSLLERVEGMAAMRLVMEDAK